MKPERVYLDWAAASPLSEMALQAMVPYLSGQFGNPSAIHAEGQMTRQAVEEARQTIASAVQVRPEFVTFTSGGTEGNNLAIFGVIESLAQSGRSYESMTVITTKIEHPSVGETCDALKRRGVEVRYVQVTEAGKIDLEQLRTLLDDSVVLFSTALINSEIGTIQPAHAIRKILKTAEEQFGTEVFFHLDAAQAPLWVNCQFDSLSADFVTLDAAKCCGPKGVGVLVRSRRTDIVPVVHGGGQESGLRPGTENVAGIVGAAVAIKEAQDEYSSRVESVSSVRDQAIGYIQSELPAVLINGAVGDERVANNINISIPGLDTEFAAVVLDKHGFAVSTKSACSGAGGGASTVVLETTTDPTRAASTLRITLGPDTTREQLQSLTVVLKQHVEQMSQY
jgi:cysteine desulfurase